MALGMAAMQLEVFAQIVSLPQADLPVAKTVLSVRRRQTGVSPFSMRR